MAGRKYDKLLSSRIEECVGSDEECACSPPNQACEGGIDVAWTARLKELQPQPRVCEPQLASPAAAQLLVGCLDLR